MRRRPRLLTCAAGVAMAMLALTAHTASAADAETAVTDALDTVYSAAEAPGQLQVTIEQLDPETGGASEGNNDTATCNSTAKQTSSAVFGGANPPVHHVTYHDSTGYTESWIEGSARIKSCMRQQFIIRVEQVIGMSPSGPNAYLRFTAPSNVWITVTTPHLKCDTSSGKQGYQYQTHIETIYGGFGEPNWQNTSSVRYWPYC